MEVGQLLIQSLPITTNIVRSNPTQATQHYVIKFGCDLRQVGDFLRVLRFPPPKPSILRNISFAAANTKAQKDDSKLDIQYLKFEIQYPNYLDIESRITDIESRISNEPSGLS